MLPLHAFEWGERARDEIYYSIWSEHYQKLTLVKRVSTQKIFTFITYTMD